MSGRSADHDDTVPVAWEEATWLNPPELAETHGNFLVFATREMTDFWRTTSYGFVHDNGHALLADLPVGHAVEVTVQADYQEQFDQAGLMVRADERTWVKAGLELTDGVLHVGAVVTRDYSDWSLRPVPEWSGTAVTVRASRGADSVTIRARSEAGPWQLLRLAPLVADGPVGAGPFACSPSRSGLRVRFSRFATGPADTALHAS